jgi:hypothetical protein
LDKCRHIPKKEKLEFEILRWLQWSHVNKVEFRVEENGDVVKQLKQINNQKQQGRNEIQKTLGF